MNVSAETMTAILNALSVAKKAVTLRRELAEAWYEADEDRRYHWHLKLDESVTDEALHEAFELAETSRERAMKLEEETAEAEASFNEAVKAIDINALIASYWQEQLDAACCNC